MVRLLTRLAWLSILAIVMLILYHATPLGRLPLLVRLHTQELQPPLLVPVQDVARTALRSTWGASRSGGRSHEGIDIFARCGQPVVSATEGVVLGKGENKLGGLTVRVLGPAGSMHYYAHLSAWGPVAAGAHVRPGDVIGFVGDTGNARGTPCHLHYGIYLGGTARDPYMYLVHESRTDGIDP